MFARYGLSDQLVTNNAAKFSSNVFAQFAKEYAFTHITTSLRSPQVNGEVEHAVQTVKHLLKKAQDPYRTLMAYRATPLEIGRSPAELLMGRKIRTRVPTVPAQLNPIWHHLKQFRKKDASLKARQKKNLASATSQRTLQTSPLENEFGYQTRVDGTVLNKASTLRSYEVETPNDELRRNRRHLNPLPETSEAGHLGHNPLPDQATPGVKTSSPVQTPTSTTPRSTMRSGREIRLPERFKD